MVENWGTDDWHGTPIVFAILWCELLIDVLLQGGMHWQTPGSVG